MDRECASCGGKFVAKRSTAKFCSTTCRSRSARAAKAAKQSVEADTAAGKPEHSLVRAVRKELEGAEAAETVAGQLALQVARRIADPECAGVSTLSKELRALLAEARGGAVPPGSGPEPEAEPVEEEDEVTRARRQREEARQAAGLA